MIKKKGEWLVLIIALIIFVAVTPSIGDALTIGNNTIIETPLVVNGNVQVNGAGNGITFPDGTTQSTATVQGPAGANGRTVLNGSTDPTSGIGSDGDFYINTTTNTIFGPKTSGVWGAGTSLVGPPGPAGSGGLPSCSLGQVLVQTSNGWQCGLIMTYPHAVGICLGATCGIISCAPNYADCNNYYDDGCEISIADDANNCGLCGNVCTDIQGCSAGQCVACSQLRSPYNFARCDYGTTCDVDLDVDANDCGTCGNVCPSGEPCNNGICQCMPGYTYCSSEQGCFDLANDVSNCGVCGHACVLVSGSLGCLCSNGQCEGEFGGVCQ